ncbi:MAG: hypothetical protein H7A51_19420 [Akkermansiaceae bacterium]|nr:hypothetical protein [Akkermansiaceae bacterium]
MKALLAAVLVFSPAILLRAQEGQDSKPIWKPEVGDFWTYQVVVEVQEGTTLPTGVDGQKIEKLDGKVRASYMQTSVYRGLKSMKEGGPEVHAFYVSNGDQLEEIEYMYIRHDAVEAAGSKQEGKAPKELMPLSKAIPLVRSEWKGGEAFPFMMDTVVGEQKIRLVRKFKVLGWETLETDAGKFKALHVQVTGLNGPMEIKRSYWFTPGTGFIKEVKKYYLGDKTVFTQTRVLEKTGKAQAKPEKE